MRAVLAIIVLCPWALGSCGGCAEELGYVDGGPADEHEGEGEGIPDGDAGVGEGEGEGAGEGEGEGVGEGEGEGEGSDDCPIVHDDDRTEPTYPGGCPAPIFNPSCDETEECSAGICLLGSCVFATPDPSRWDQCGDGTCGSCESVSLCPSDCAAEPATCGEIDWGAPDTLTVLVHGFRFFSTDDESDVRYGEVIPSEAVLDGILSLSPDVADGRLEPANPRQIVGVEYYGTEPADWVSSDEVAEIESYSAEGLEAVHRYALVVARFIRHRLALSGSSQVNVLCESMGCHVTRYMLERDIGALMSNRRIARWITVHGVVNGARSANLGDDPAFQELLGPLHLTLSDFVHLTPDAVADYSLVWDHQRFALNNPLFRDVLVHHVSGTDPWLRDVLPLLSLTALVNDRDEAADGVLMLEDTFAARQDLDVQAVAASGRRHPPSHTTWYVNHAAYLDHPGTHVLAAAALFHSRKVFIRLTSLTVHDVHEADGPLDFSESGDGDADVVVESRVRFDPFVDAVLGHSGLVMHEQTFEHRSAPLVFAPKDAVQAVDVPVFSGPVLDEMDSLWLRIVLREVDDYTRYGLDESILPGEVELLTWEGFVPLIDGEIALESDDASGTLAIEVASYP